MKDRKKTNKEVEGKEIPLYRTGPGGDYSQAVPGMNNDIDGRIERGLARLSKDLGLKTPLVSYGPGGVEFSEAGREFGSVARKMLNVIRKVGIGDRNAKLADSILVGDQIEAAERAMEMMRAKPIETPAPEVKILKMASASLNEIAMPAGCDGRVTTNEVSGTVKVAGKEHDYDGIDAEEDGDTPVYPGVQKTAWLFSNLGGNRGTSRSNKSNRVRSHKSANRKRRAGKGAKTQRSLFADI